MAIVGKTTIMLANNIRETRISGNLRHTTSLRKKVSDHHSNASFVKGHIGRENSKEVQAHRYDS